MKRFLKYFLLALSAAFILLNLVAALHAYKFTHYYEPGEVAVKNQNEKHFGDYTKEAFLGINFFKKKNQASPNSTFETIYLTTNNGLKLQAWKVNAINPKGTVALFHGHGGNKSGVLKEASEFLKLGYNVFLTDFRAHGNSQGNTCTIGFDEAEDVRIVYDHIKAGGEKNIVLWGISLGAATITRAVSEFECKPEKIILELPFGSVEEAVEARLRMMHLPEEPLASLLTFWGGIENRFWAFDHKPSNYVKSITCPVLLQFGKNDIRVTEKEMKDLYKNITAPKRLVLYENSAHESLCKKENEKWVTNVTAFLQQ